jgi:hypothetical protein
MLSATTLEIGLTAPSENTMYAWFIPSTTWWFVAIFPWLTTNPEPNASRWPFWSDATIITTEGRAREKICEGTKVVIAELDAVRGVQPLPLQLV